MELQPKRTSKTLWFNGIMFGMIVVASVGGALQVLMPSTTAIVDTILGVVITIGNAYIRIFLTTMPLDTPANRVKLAGKLDAVSNLPITADEITEGGR